MKIYLIRKSSDGAHEPEEVCGIFLKRKDAEKEAVRLRKRDFGENFNAPYYKAEYNIEEWEAN